MTAMDVLGGATGEAVEQLFYGSEAYGSPAARQQWYDLAFRVVYFIPWHSLEAQQLRQQALRAINALAEADPLLRKTP